MVGGKLGKSVKGTERQGKRYGSEHEHLFLVSLGTVAVLDPMLDKRFHTLITVQYYY